MANALPMAIGAQVSHPGRQVVSLSGDGGLAMLLGELLTVKTHHLPVKVVVFNNSSLGMVRLEMLVAGDPPFETDHDQVDYAAIAAAAGFFTRRVTEPGDLRGAAKAVFGPRRAGAARRGDHARRARGALSHHRRGGPRVRALAREDCARRAEWAEPSWRG